jgi:hypothetical protein
MKQRTFLAVFLSFLAGMGVAYGLIHLDRKATVPRLDWTDVFEVVTSDGTIHRLSYAEVEREREELRDLRQRAGGLKSSAVHRKGRSLPPPAQAPTLPPPEVTSREAAETRQPKAPEKKLKDLFAKIFSQPIMQDLLEAQITREAGELADVLDLTDEQLASVEEELKKRRKRFPRGPEATPPKPAKEEAEPQTTLQEELQTILTPEQYQKYEEYTEKKKALIGSPALDREVFELDWRLKLTEEQEAPVREILSEQGEKLRQIPLGSAMEGDASPAERLQQHLDRRTALNKETADRMKTVLEEDQYEIFLRYQEERDTETRLLKRLIQEEMAGEAPATQ